MNRISKIKGEYFEYLPSSITHLKLCRLELLENEGLRKLPNNLQDLELLSIPKLTNECLNYLPTSLISLKTNYNNTGMTYEGTEEWKKRNKVY